MKYKIIAKDGVRINGKTLPAGAIIAADALPKDANIKVALQLKQIEELADTAAAPAPEKKK